MNRSDLFGFISDRFNPRTQATFTPLQCWLALGLWAVAAVTAVLLNLGTDQATLADVAYFTILQTITIAFSVRLPQGGYIGLITATLAACALVIGPRPALLLPLLATLIVVPGALLLSLRVRNLRRHRQAIIFESLWHSAALTLALLAAGHLYEVLSGPRFPVSLTPLSFWLIAGFIVLLFGLSEALNTLWLALSSTWLARYWRQNWGALVSGNLLAALVFAPLVATFTSGSDSLRLLSLLPFTASALLAYSIASNQLALLDRVGDLRALNSIGQALNANLDFDDLLQAIRYEIGKLLDADGFYLALYDDREERIHFPVLYEDGLPRPTMSRPFANGLTEYIIRTRRSLFLSHDQAQQAAALGIEPQGRDSKCYLGVPVIAGEQVIGVMALRHFTQEYVYDQNDLRLLETIAASAAVALQNARLYRQRQRQAAELALLNQVSTLISANLDQEELLQTICRVVIELMGCQKSAVFLLDADGRHLRLAGSVGLSEEYINRSLRINLEQDVRALAATDGTPVISEDILAKPHLASLHEAARREGFRGVIDVPLQSGDRTLGILTAYYSDPRRFDPGTVELLQTLGGQVAVAVENASLFEATNERRRELEMLYDTARQINASLSLENVLQAVAQNMLKVLDVDTCVMLLAHDSGQVFRAELQVSSENGSLTRRTDETITFTRDNHPEIGHLLDSHEPLILDEVGQGRPELPHTLLDHFELQGGIVLPLVIHGQTVGMIVAGCRGAVCRLQAEVLRPARVLAEQAAVAIQNARLFEQTDVALSRRLDEIAALEMISQRMTRRLDLQAVIEQVVQAAAVATNAEVCELLLLDENRQVLKVSARQGPPADSGSTEWSANEGVTGRALRTGLAALVPDVSQDPDYIEGRAKVRSELAVPIILDGQRLGVINLESVQLNSFDHDQARFITNLAEHAAIAIQNARLFESMQRRAEEFQTLRSIAVDLLSSFDLNHTLKVIARQALERTIAQDVHIYLYDHRSDTLTFGTSLWANGDVDREFGAPRPEGMTATVARTGERLIVTDLAGHPLFKDVVELPGWETLEAMVSLPLKRGIETIGVFNIAFGNRIGLTEDILHFLDLLAAQAAVAIANTRLAEETRTGRDRLQAILNSIHDGILMFDTGGRLVMTNPRAEQMLNFPLSKEIGGHYTGIIEKMLSNVSEESAASLRQTINMAAGGEEISSERVIQRTYRLEQPTLRVINLTSIPVHGEAGELLGHLSTLRDVTSEHEIELYRQEMSHMIVHDLRSPLAGVITGLTLASEELQYLAMDKHRDMLEATVNVALTSANALLRLVEEILDVNKLEAGEIPLILEERNLKDVASHVVQVLQNTASEADIRLTLEAPDDLAPAAVDVDKIERVFTNLIDNALRYTPDGGSIRVTLAQTDDEFTVAVSDSGEGVPADLRERIFERFVQGNVMQRKRGAKGSGLGLTFCRLAVEAHGGRIWVGTAEEGGAAFHFTLPRKGPAAA